MENLLQDLRYAFRALRRSPGFTVVAVLTLALGIGANSAIFSVVDAVLLRPLAYAAPEQLVALRGMVNIRGLVDANSSEPEFRNFRDDVPAVASAAAVWPININLSGVANPERIQAAVVSYNYTNVLGVQPVLGRGFSREDTGGRIGYVALISWELWQRRFGGDSAVIGKVAKLDDDPITVIGVMPRGFRHPMERGASPMELWAPIDMDNPDTTFVNNRGARVFEVIGRLKPGVTVREAQAQLDVLTGRLTQQYPAYYPTNLGWRASAIPLAERVVGDVRPALLVLLGAVGLVLLIACANVANLMLTRATGRSRELAIRTAMGSSRGRLVRQLLTESVVLALMGGGLGLFIATWGTAALGRLATLYLPRAGNIGLNSTVLWFTAGLSILTGIAFGLLPAWQSSRTDVQSVLKDSSRGTSTGSRARARATLVVVELAVALVLVAGAGLLLRSFQRLVAVEPGFDPSHLLTMQVWLPWPNKPETGRFFTNQQRVAFYDRLRESIVQVPGVQEVALTTKLPLNGTQGTRFRIEGRTQGADEQPPRAELRGITPNYFAAMRIPMLRGTSMPLADSAEATSIVVNKTFADKFFPGENPIGRRIQLFGPAGDFYTVVGEVGDVRQVALETPPREEIYYSYRRIAGLEMSVVARTAGDPAAQRAAVLQAIRTVDAQQPVFGVRPMTQLLAESGAARRFSLLLLTLFAGIALLLSAIGIYGVMSYSTAQRQQEIGIRMALGAVGKDVLSLVVGQGMRLVALGLMIGLVGAWALSRLLASQLYQITASDPLTFGAAAALLGLVAMAASVIPARRATRVDPMVAMRSE
ncbi:MAG TPA: ABC transporter permease [Gemmatimonadales bacterium]|jgi:predicted permease